MVPLGACESKVGLQAAMWAVRCDVRNLVRPGRGNSRSLYIAVPGGACAAVWIAPDGVFCMIAACGAGFDSIACGSSTGGRRYNRAAVAFDRGLVGFAATGHGIRLAFGCRAASGSGLGWTCGFACARTVPPPPPDTLLRVLARSALKRACEDQPCKCKIP